MIDLWGKNSRDEFIECEYWSINEKDFYNDRLIRERKPTGFFRAKEVNSYVTDNQAIGEVFFTKQHNVTLETHDNVSDLKTNDYVKLNDKMFRVDSIQEVPVKKQRMFMAYGYSKTFFISLRS